MATRLKLKTVWRRHWQRGPHLRFFSTFLPYCLICNRWSARAFLLVFLEKAVLISQVQITRLHLVSLAVCVWESRDTQRFCTTETQLNCYENIYFLMSNGNDSLDPLYLWKFLLKQMKRFPSTASQPVFPPGEPGSDSHSLASDVPLHTIPVLSQVKTHIHISAGKLGMGDSCRIFQEVHNQGDWESKQALVLLCSMFVL